VTTVLTPKYHIKFIVRQIVEILQQKKKLRKDIYRLEEVKGTEKIDDANRVTPYFQYTMTIPFVNLVI
jgi:hypothetical protein